jgi:hypothetical protein
MNILGFGVPEIVLIVVLALILLGPKDMVKTGRTLGKFLRKTIFSPTWLNIQQKVRNLPFELAREAGFEEDELNWGTHQFKKDLNNKQILKDMGVNDLVQEVKQATEVPSEWLTPSIGSHNTIDPELGSSPSVPSQEDEERA